MRLVTYRRGRAAARVGALADDVVFDLAALAADRASEQGAVRRGRGGFPKTMLALIQGGTDAWNDARQALDHGLALLGREGLDRLAERRLASPLARVRLEAPIPRPARNLQKRHGQWFKGKTLDTFCPMGPVLVTADEIPDPQALAITLRVNGETRQSSHTSKMIFPVDECISVLSEGFTILPGDVIATGTPEGVGAATGKFLKVGDKIEAEVEKIGVLANRVVAPPADGA